MRAQQSTPTRKRLIALLSGARIDGAQLMLRLRQLRRLEGVATCSEMVYLMTHLQLAEDEAEQLLLELDTHRQQLTRDLGRDPGLSVAAIDYLSNIRELLLNPTIVELDEFDSTLRSAFTDDLTGLKNRRHFDSALELEVRRSTRYGLALSLLFLDLDRFKPLNDRHGHLYGDRVLETLGALILRVVRESDVACRTGGEEFAVILPETNRLGAYTLAERLRVAIAENFRRRTDEGQRIDLTVSGGIAEFPTDGSDPDALTHAAERALNLAKTTGRDRIVVFHEERRRDVRFPVRERVRVRLRCLPLGHSIELRPLDMSCRGMLLAGAAQGTPPVGRVELVLASRREPEQIVSGTIVRQDGLQSAVEFREPLTPERLASHVHPAIPALRPVP